MPSVGLRRIEPKAFETKWLNWIGPWQWDMFLAKMEEDREISDALIVGMRLSFEPIKNFEVGISRTLQLCGDGRPCNFSSWTRALISIGDLDNPTTDEGRLNEPGNQLANLELSYTLPIGKNTYVKMYADGTTEDLIFLIPYKYTKLLGLSFYGPYGEDGSQWRLTTEYTDTVSTLVWLLGTKELNLIYEHHIYKTGYRYKGRSLGNSLDNDSKLLSVVAQFQNSNGWEYTAKYHRANINIDGSGKNSISVPNKKLNIFEASVQGDMGVGNLKFDLRYSTDGIPALGNDGSFTSVGVTWNIRY